MTEQLWGGDRLDPGLIARFRATLEPWLFPVPADCAPLGSHWCLFPPLAPMAALGPDGHAPRLHQVSLEEFPRRMWVGGSLRFHGSFPLGTDVARTTGLLPIERKGGRTGALMFTGFTHSYADGDRLLCEERQDIVFRPAEQAERRSTPSPEPLPKDRLTWEIETTPALLFRYSAVTFNSHRIHYDGDYARDVEGYAGILVHGPLQATVLLNMAAHLLGHEPSHFEYRAKAPLVAGCFARAHAWPIDGAIACVMMDASGTVTMQGRAA